MYRRGRGPAWTLLAGRFAPPGGAPTPPSSRAWGPYPTPGRRLLVALLPRAGPQPRPPPERGAPTPRRAVACWSLCSPGRGPNPRRAVACRERSDRQYSPAVDVPIERFEELVAEALD